MTDRREVLEDEVQDYERELAGLKSYIRELKDQTSRHETDRDQYEADLIEAEHNVKFYEAEITRLRQELRGGGSHGGSRLPRAAWLGIDFFVASAIGFVAGVFLGSQLKPGSKDRGGEGDTPPPAQAP